MQLTTKWCFIFSLGLALVGCEAGTVQNPGSDPADPADSTDASDTSDTSDASDTTETCTEGSMQDGETPCGLNNEGVYTQVCENGAWVNTSDCTGTDECLTGNVQDGETACGLNDNGVYEQICENGSWADTDTCNDADICTNGDIQDGMTVCGLNDEGIYLEECTDGAWLETTTCTGTDVCENGTVQNGQTECGLNDEGVLTQTCTDGTWVDTTDCTGTDICLNGDYQNSQTQCGLNNEGVFLEDCISGAWVITENCTGTDVCTNGDTQPGETVCEGGTLFQECTEGQWVDTDNCSCVSTDDDIDCDGIVAGEDCNDEDPNSTTVATDADCDDALTENDCNDESALFNPSINEVCPGIDQNCDDDTTAPWLGTVLTGSKTDNYSCNHYCDEVYYDMPLTEYGPLESVSWTASIKDQGWGGCGYGGRISVSLVDSSGTTKASMGWNSPDCSGDRSDYSTVTGSWSPIPSNQSVTVEPGDQIRVKAHAVYSAWQIFVDSVDLTVTVAAGSTGSKTDNYDCSHYCTDVYYEMPIEPGPLKSVSWTASIKDQGWGGCGYGGHISLALVDADGTAKAGLGWTSPSCTGNRSEYSTVTDSWAAVSTEVPLMVEPGDKIQVKANAVYSGWKIYVDSIEITANHGCNVCDSGTTQDGTTSCNDTGVYIQECIDGNWVNSTTCTE